MIRLADSDDLQPDVLAGTVDLEITAQGGGTIRTATVSILLDGPLWLSVLGTPPFISFLGRFNNLQAAFDAAPGGGLIPGGGTVRVDQSLSSPATALATVTSDNLLFNVAATTDSSFNLALSAGVQNLTHIGSGRVTINGNAEDNTLVGGSLASILYGRGGNDTLVGREGDDVLIGGTGADDMRGGPDDDFYGVDDLGDIVTERADEGVDTVSTALDDFHLPDHVEVLVLATGVQRAFGNALNNQIYMHFGGTEGQILDGGAGQDTMQGGFGDDVYIVDNALDTVIEGVGGGDDEVRASVTFDLQAEAAGVERLTLTGTARIDGQGTGEANVMQGNGGANRLEGRDGSDSLFGGGGDDTLDGGTGNDRLRGDGGDGGDDTLIGGTGNDRLIGQGGNDVLSGGEGDDTLDGGSGGDDLAGGDGSDVLRGGDGEDDLSGGTGLDFLTGGVDADCFKFASIGDAGLGADRDQILDFEKGLDLIDLSEVAAGTLDFRGTGAFAPSGNAELRLLETPTGSTIVQIDVDGNGTVDAEIRVANVAGLTAGDFIL
ncbi:calcium-binding protein [Antarctobacter sp.]|uniref:calcium-binding protein n=1 Tax=Antarctobacter sp. TaxID=1872577 RepID=UPI003A8E9B59